MKDKFSRQIDYLRISITPLCNLFCSYCRKADEKKEKKYILTSEDILQVVKVCINLGINRFRLTGGEPLLRQDCVEIVEKISALKGLKDISLTTNGILLSKYAQTLKKAGLERLNVSLDTLSREKFKEMTGKDLLDDVFLGIKKAQEVGLAPLKLNVVLIKKINFDEVFDFINFSLNLNLQVRFIELMPRSHNDKFFEENFVSADELKDVIKNRFDLSKMSTDDSFVSDTVMKNPAPNGEVSSQRGKFIQSVAFHPRAEARGIQGDLLINGSGPAHYYNLSDKGGVIGIISPLSEGFCNSCNRFRLTSDGKLRLCLFDETEIDLKPVLEKKDSKLLEKFFKKAILQKPKEKISGAVCGDMVKIGG